eukprot:7855621-Lingulodinium_polyedra.AAC.1
MEVGTVHTQWFAMNLTEGTLFARSEPEKLQCSIRMHDSRCLSTSTSPKHEAWATTQCALYYSTFRISDQARRQTSS